jgi:hypothetical protein
MGANQSKTPIANEKLIIERLGVLEIKDRSDNDYVHVDEKAVKGSKTHFRAPWTAVSVSDVEHWEHELLQDPKNRHVSLPLLQCNQLTDNKTRTLCPKLRRSQNRTDLSIDYNQRPTNIQRQDSLRRRTDYQPTLLRTMLALRSHERLPRRADEATQPR